MNPLTKGEGWKVDIIAMADPDLGSIFGRQHAPGIPTRRHGQTLAAYPPPKQYFLVVRREYLRIWYLKTIIIHYSLLTASEVMVLVRIVATAVVKGLVLLWLWWQSKDAKPKEPYTDNHSKWSLEGVPCRMGVRGRFRMWATSQNSA